MIVGKKRPVKHVCALNLRTQVLSHLVLALAGINDKESDETRKDEHDMHALKRLETLAMRQQAMVGEKVMDVYDRASIDLLAWNSWTRRTRLSWPISRRGKTHVGFDPRHSGFFLNRKAAESRLSSLQ